MDAQQWEADERTRMAENDRRHAERLAELNAAPAVDPQELAERNAHLVMSSDMIARREAGVPDPGEGHDVAEWAAERWPLPEPAEGPEPVDREALKAEIKAELRAELGL